MNSKNITFTSLKTKMVMKLDAKKFMKIFKKVKLLTNILLKRKKKMDLSL